MKRGERLVDLRLDLGHGPLDGLDEAQVLLEQKPMMVIFVPLPFSFDVPTAAPSVGEFARDLGLYFLVGDFCSYWWHRIEHQNGWYAKRVHHADRPPLSIWTAMVVHPVEGFSVFVFFHLYGIVFPIHLLTFAVAAFAMTAVPSSSPAASSPSRSPGGLRADDERRRDGKRRR